MFFRPKSFKIFKNLQTNLSSLKNVNYPLLNLKIQNNSLKYCHFFFLSLTYVLFFLFTFFIFP